MPLAELCTAFCRLDVLGVPRCGDAPRGYHSLISAQNIKNTGGNCVAPVVRQKGNFVALLVRPEVIFVAPQVPHCGCFAAHFAPRGIPLTN